MQGIKSLFKNTLFFMLPLASLQAEEAIVKSINSFGFNAYHAVKETVKENPTLAPFSLYVSLLVPLEGASGKTKEQMELVMHLSPSGGSPGPQLTALQKDLSLAHGHDHVTILSASALWMQKNNHFHQEFLENVRRFFFQQFKEINFSDRPEESRHEINRWVRQETQGKIKDLYAPGSISAQVKALLISTFYFNGLLKVPFEFSKTKRGAFVLENQAEVQVPLMTQTFLTPYMETEQVQLVELPFVEKSGQSQKFSLFLLLPKKGVSTIEIEKVLSYDNFKNWMRRLREMPVLVTLPKIHLFSRLDLNDPLEQLGMKSLFNDQADFSKMLSKNQIYLNQVTHAAMMNLEEAGGGLTGRPMESKNPSFKDSIKGQDWIADHPFFFFLIEKKTGQILLLGKVTRPL